MEYFDYSTKALETAQGYSLEDKIKYMDAIPWSSLPDNVLLELKSNVWAMSEETPRLR